ncbi:DUF262 domain-containing protein [Hymenobacter sp. DH14]|uniref:DUF262 domain-containing protein n=1 Tax=Hymenobacter cyanobacteriorum TaxID=2926463 RepID=A0A9X1VM84_9BACT|nr:DUF262 domain-containing protein [Hymenobacter cyanobacteriorum]MCI1188741.1 DUF262 domain-containing protein [Hymenobacter cyanobacteriorum]
MSVLLRVRILHSVPTHVPVLLPGDEPTLSANEANQLIADGLAELAPLPDPVPASRGDEATATDTTQAGVEQETIESDSPTDSTDPAAITQPFDPAKIDIQTRQGSIDTILKRLKHGEINLQTPFQRQADLWKDREQSRLIESILIRFPLPAFYFDGSNPEKWLVVDGLQRLSSLRRFVIDKDLKLRGLEYLKQFENMGYDDLPRPLQRTIEETQITQYIIQAGTPERVKFNLFKRINTGGLTLTSQEIRHALNQGVPADFVAELAESPAFLTATGGSISPRRMDDRDFVMRFIAFYLRPYEKYVPELDTYLNAQMATLATLAPVERASLKADFEHAMLLAHDIFGRQAFRKLTTLTPKGVNPINKALFEVWSVCLSRLTPAQGKALIDRKREVLKALVRLIKSDQFLRAISAATGDRRRVIERFSAVEHLIVAELRATDVDAFVPDFVMAPTTSQQLPPFIDTL